MTGIENRQEFSLPNPGKNRAASLDLGVRFSGVSLWETGIYSQSLLISSDCPVQSEAPIRMADRVIDFLREESVTLVLLEDYGYGGGFFRTEQAEMVGMLKRAIIYELPEVRAMVSLAPNTVKSIVTGTGRASKSEMIRSVEQRGYTCPTSHEADAIAIYLAYNEVWKEPNEVSIRRGLFKAASGRRKK